MWMEQAEHMFQKICLIRGGGGKNKTTLKLDLEGLIKWLKTPRSKNDWG